jgi:hypothetical protein
MPDLNGSGYLLFLWSPAGYTLREVAALPPPPLGDEIENGDLTVVVTKIGASPLPGDARPCAYTVGK